MKVTQLITWDAVEKPVCLQLNLLLILHYNIHWLRKNLKPKIFQTSAITFKAYILFGCKFWIKECWIAPNNHVKKMRSIWVTSPKCFSCYLWIWTALVFLYLCKGIPTVHVAFRVLYHQSWLEAAEVGMGIMKMVSCFFYLFCFTAFCICFSVMLVVSPRVDSLWAQLNSYSLISSYMSQIKIHFYEKMFIVVLMKLHYVHFDGWWYPNDHSTNC